MRIGIIVGAHRRHNQVVTVLARAGLHIGDQLRNGRRLQEHHYHGGKHKLIITVEAYLIQVALFGMYLLQLLFRDDAVKALRALRIVVPAVTVKPC